MTPIDDPHQRRDFGLQLLRLGRRWRNVVDGELRQYGLTLATWRALFHLGESGRPVRPKDLADLLEMERPSLTQLLDRLEHQGLIRRTEDPADLRCKTVTLTEQGRAVHRQTVQTSTQVAERLLGAVDDDQLTQVLALFERLSTALEQAEAALAAGPPVSRNEPPS